MWRGDSKGTIPNEPQHDKTNEVSVRPAKTQISLGIRPVWSESSLSAWRNLGFLATHWGHSKSSDQTGRMPRLIWVFAGRTLILLVLSCRGSNDSLIFFFFQSFSALHWNYFATMKILAFQILAFQIHVSCCFTVMSLSFSDRLVWANSVVPDQAAPRGVVWSGSTLFAIPSASFGPITV